MSNEKKSKAEKAETVKHDEHGRGVTPGTTQNTRITDPATEGDSVERAERKPEKHGRDRLWTQESKPRWNDGPTLAELLAESRDNEASAAAAENG